MLSVQTCQICDREAVFLCGDCKQAKYCCNQHRNQHWRLHKEPCKVIKQEATRQLQNSANRGRLQIRRLYFQNYTHRVYDKCLMIAKQLLQLEQAHIKVTKQIFIEFEYGIAVCLMARTYLLVGRSLEAKQFMDHYIRQKLHFLEDLRNIPSLKQNPQYSNKAKLFLERKLSLISAVANIYHNLKQNCIKYYQIYTNHIELVFGPDSYELSNAYFCIGNYYREINEITKAIACFVKAATIRGRKGGGDCFVNISLLYRAQGKTQAAIDMMETAIKLNEQEYGSSSREVGEAYQKLGLLYLDLKNYNNTILYLQSALKIYVNQRQSDDYQRIKAKIEILYAKVKILMDNENNQKRNKKLKEEEENKKREDLHLQKQQNALKAAQLQKLFKVTDNLMNKLSPAELLRLSELQMELQKCRSEFAMAQVVGNSEFLKKLSDNRRRQLKNDNEKLFQLISIEFRLKASLEDSNN